MKRTEEGKKKRWYFHKYRLGPTPITLLLTRTRITYSKYAIRWNMFGASKLLAFCHSFYGVAIGRPMYPGALWVMRRHANHLTDERRGEP